MNTKLNDTESKRMNFYYTVLKNFTKKSRFKLSIINSTETVKFSQQKNLLETKITELNLQRNEIINELAQVKKQKMEKENARNARINRTRRPKRQNMTLDIYQ